MRRPACHRSRLSALLALTILAGTGLVVSTEAAASNGPASLDRLEAYLTRELDRARSDQRECEKTLAAARALLVRARASGSSAAVAAAERTVGVGTQALGRNRLREQKALRALAWVARLRTEGSPGPLAALLSHFAGSVEVLPAGGEPVRRLSGDVPPAAGPGDTIRTGADGRADLLLPDGGLLSLDARTVVTLLEEGLELLSGEIRALLEKRMGRRMKTPTAVLGIRGTEFTVRAREGRPVAVVVLEGEVTFSDRAETRTVLVGAGQQSYILPDGLPAPPSKANMRDMYRWWEDAP